MPGVSDARPRERVRGDDLLLVDLLRESPAVVDDHVPDEQPEQRRQTTSDGADLGAAAHQTMKTVVPTSHVVEQPLGVHDLHPDAAVRRVLADRARARRCRGSRRPAPRGPSSACRAGCPAPAARGSSPAAHASYVGGYHHGFIHLTTMSKRPRRRRVDRLAGRDGETRQTALSPWNSVSGWSPRLIRMTAP